MSDTQSLTSESSGTASNSAFLELEDIGKLSLAGGDYGINVSTTNPIKRLIISDQFLVALLDEGQVLLGEIRGSKDWSLYGKHLGHIPGPVVSNGGRYIDVALGYDGNQEKILVVLGERKNKPGERFIAAHPITFNNRCYDLEDEIAVYDKSNVLGKGLTALTAFNDSIFTVSNLIRKLKVGDMKPTTARVQIPNDCLDGIIDICAIPSSGPKSKSKAQNQVILALKTKSLSGKGKYAIEWYGCNSKDDLTHIKTASTRLNENSEPVCLLADPKDGRGLYVIYNNGVANTSSLHRLSKSASSEAIVNWDFAVQNAAIGWINEVLTIAIIPEGSPNQLRLFAVHKTDGFRSRHPGCSNCIPLDAIGSPAHVISCASTKWRLSPQTVDEQVFAGTGSQNVLGLGSLYQENGSPALEPDTGNPYRVRVLGCPIRGMHPVAILLEDLDRSFDGDLVTLSSCVLKLCLSAKPCRNSYALLTAWIKANKLCEIELYYVKSNNNNNEDNSMGDVDRFISKPIAQEKFKSLIIDNDWSIFIHQRPISSLTESTGGGGTFTLEPEMSESRISRPMSASTVGSTRSSVTSISNSRIPTPKAVGNSSCLNQSLNEEELLQSNQRLRDLCQRMATTLTTILDVDVALRNNVMSLHETLAEVQEEISPSNAKY